MFTINQEIDINAGQEIVFELLTTSDQITHYHPYKSVESEWHVDTPILFQGSNEGQVFMDHGIIEALSKPNEFRYRYWSDNHGTEQVPENYLTISYILEPRSDGTVVKLSHSDIRSEEYFLAMISAWPVLLEELKKYAENNKQYMTGPPNFDARLKR